MTEIDRAREKSRLVLSRWVDSMSKMPEGIAIIEIECLKTMLTAAFREYESEAEALKSVVRDMAEALEEAAKEPYKDSDLGSLLTTLNARANEVLARHHELLERIGAVKS